MILDPNLNLAFMYENKDKFVYEYGEAAFNFVTTQLKLAILRGM